MRTDTLLGLTLAATLAMGMPVLAADAPPPIKEVVSFGDSLSDAGTFGFRFTTHPGPTWAMLVAAHYGDRQQPNETGDYRQAYQGVHGTAGPDGLNYAEAGAKVSTPYAVVSSDPDGLPISAARQLDRYLAAHRGFRPDQLVTLYVGANDIFWPLDPVMSASTSKPLSTGEGATPQLLAQARQSVVQAAKDIGPIVRRMLDHGAERLLVLNVYDLGQSPVAETPAMRANLSDFTAAYNEALSSVLPKDDRILVFDNHRFVSDLLADHRAHGFTHGAHEDACRTTEYCVPNTYAEADADMTYVFAGSVHFTRRVNQMLAESVLALIAQSPLR